MRIVAGEFKGRRLKPPALPARATAERVREAWFNILAPVINDAVVLDLFAGSGALALEALSRGASHATMVERARKSLSALEANVAALDVYDRVTVERMDVFRFLDAQETDVEPFDLAFADPPFDGDEAVQLVDAFRARPFARILGVEHASAVSVTGDDQRRYGDVAITFCYQ